MYHIYHISCRHYEHVLIICLVHNIVYSASITASIAKAAAIIQLQSGLVAQYYYDWGCRFPIKMFILLNDQ